MKISTKELNYLICLMQTESSRKAMESSGLSNYECSFLLSKLMSANDLTKTLISMKSSDMTEEERRHYMAIKVKQDRQKANLMDCLKYKETIIPARRGKKDRNE